MIANLFMLEQVGNKESVLLNGVQAARSFNRAMVAQQYGMTESTPEVLLALAKHAKENPERGSEIDVDDEWKGRLIKHGIISVRGGRMTLSKRGHRMAQELAQTLPVGFLPMVKVNAGTAIQRLVRDARADLQTMTQRPFFLDRWWWRHTLWNLKRWWAGTTPERPVVDMGYLKPYVAWSEEDEEQQKHLWIEDHYSGFWNCPKGVDAGLHALDEFDRLAGEHREVMPQVIDAVVAIAKLAMSLPPKRTYLPAPDDYDDEYDIDAMDYDPGNIRERLKRSSDMTQELRARHQQDQAFIVIDPKTSHVVAVPSALELADEQATRAVAALNGGMIKPAMWALMDEFDAVWKGQVLASQKPKVLIEEAVTKGKTVYSREVVVEKPRARTATKK